MANDETGGQLDLIEPDERPERAFHLEQWCIAPAALQPEVGTVIIDLHERVIATFQSENHRADANRIMKALAKPEARQREAQNYAIRQQLRANRRLRRRLTLRSYELDEAMKRLRELTPLGDRTEQLKHIAEAARRRVDLEAATKKAKS